MALEEAEAQQMLELKASTVTDFSYDLLHQMLKILSGFQLAVLEAGCQVLFILSKLVAMN